MQPIVNENGLKLKPALFMHIQKTAGTSIVDLAASYYGGSHICSHGDFLGRPPQDFAGTPFVTGHFGYDYARGLMDGRFCFTFLREPAARILSLYYFSRSCPPSEYEIYNLARENDLERFLQLAFEIPMVRATIWNHQSWQLAHGFGRLDHRSIMHFQADEILKLALAHVDAFDHIGFTESFEKDSGIILKKLGMPPQSEIVRSNVTKDKPILNELPTTTRKLLEQLTELDREVYQYSLSRRKRSFLQRLFERG